MTNIQWFVPSQIETLTRPSLLAQKQPKTMELAIQMISLYAQFHRNSVKYYHALTEVKTHFLARNATAKCHNKICNATTLLLQR